MQLTELCVTDLYNCNPLTMQLANQTKKLKSRINQPEFDPLKLSFDCSFHLLQNSTSTHAAKYISENRVRMFSLRNMNAFSLLQTQP